MWEYNYYPNADELYHHGIMGMKWGKRNGPPYPLGASDHSASEKKAGWRKSLDSDGKVAAAKKAKKDAKKNVKKTAAKARHETNKYQSHLSKNVSPSKKVRKSAEKQRQKAFDSRVDAAVARNDYKKAKKEYRDAKKEARNTPEAIQRRQEIGKKAAKVALGAAVGAAVIGGAVVVAKSGVGRNYYKKQAVRNLNKMEYTKALDASALNMQTKKKLVYEKPQYKAKTARYKQKAVKDYNKAQYYKALGNSNRATSDIKYTPSRSQSARKLISPDDAYYRKDYKADAKRRRLAKYETGRSGGFYYR